MPAARPVLLFCNKRGTETPHVQPMIRDYRSALLCFTPLLYHVAMFELTQKRGERTCRLVTMGCKVNQYETQLVREALERNGYREAGEGQPGDLCAVNTCTVTTEADSKAREIIRRLAKEQRGAHTVICGGYAAREPETLARLPGVIAVVGDNRELPDVLERFGVADWPTGVSRFDGHR